MIDGDQVDEPTPEGVDAPIVSKGSKFETFFDAPYNEIKGVLKDAVLPGQRVLDLGANKGNLEDFLDTLDSPLDVECVDTDEEALEELRVKKFENLAVGIVLADANEFIEGYTGDAIDVVLINATLHEINTPDNQREYLRHFFERMAAIL